MIQEMSITSEGVIRGNDMLPDNIIYYYIYNMHKMASYLAYSSTMCQKKYYYFEI
jgi:hypothetical protein